jgi:hypothetical protein
MALNYLSQLNGSRQIGNNNAIVKKQKRWKKQSHMKKKTFTRQKIENMLAGLLVLSKPHPQTTGDGKTVTRDFEMPAKARWMLIETMTTLKEKSDEKEEKRMRMVQTFLPKGEATATQDQISEFQKQFMDLMNEKVTVEVYEVFISDEPTQSPDTIDLTKAPIPISALVDLNRTILISKSAPQTGFGDSTVAADPATPA